MAIRRQDKPGRELEQDVLVADYPPARTTRNGTRSRNGSAARQDSRADGIPKWRRIEMLREREQLRQYLQEVWDDEIDFGDAFALDDFDHDRFYTSAEMEQAEAILDEDLDSDELDELED